MLRGLVFIRWFSLYLELNYSRTIRPVSIITHVPIIIGAMEIRHGGRPLPKPKQTRFCQRSCVVNVHPSTLDPHRELFSLSWVPKIAINGLGVRFIYNAFAAFEN